MIGRLHGTLLLKQPPALLIDVQGVGYELEAPMSTFYTLPESGAQVTVYTHFVVREDAHLLYGFATLLERGLFRDLIRVNGVGPRLALAILSGMDVHAFVRCITEADTAALIRVPGVGKKTAERLVVEMRDRIEAQTSDIPSVTRTPSAVDDAINALLTLGYRPPEAARLVQSVRGENFSVEELIRRALQATLRS